MSKQADNGKAWEYGFARVLAQHNEILITRNRALEIAKSAYHNQGYPEQRRLDRAADAASGFLLKNDQRTGDIVGIKLQGDRTGQHGDVRDVVLTTRAKTEIGISSKNRHRALKHSRLSPGIDFGNSWYGVPCSNGYWESVNPRFEALRKSTVRNWRDLPDKVGDFYQPILKAFVTEVQQFAVPERLIRYVIGKHDFYKVIKENGSVVCQSFNLDGSLMWGAKLPIPTRVVECRVDSERDATAVLICDEGWQLSFRLHNARSKIEPSLKFDIQLVGQPQQLATHTERY